MKICRTMLPSLFAAWLLIGLAVGSLLSHVVRADDTADNNRNKLSTLSARPPWTTSRIHGSPETPAPYRIVPAFPGVRFDRPTSIEEFPNDDRLLITEIDGKMFSFAKDASVRKADLLVDLRKLLPDSLAEQNVSLWDAEFHPRFQQNRQLFVCYVHPEEGGVTRVSRLSVTKDSPPRMVPDSERVLIRWPSGGHNGGCLEFGKDGYLYISTGDGTGPNPPDGLTTGQDVTDLLGAILRIDVDRTSGELNYAIPSDNPFVELDGARAEIWAYGLRNPWKIGVDYETGDIFAADNGWESWEMVHRIVRGGNCGWPIMEGRAALRTEVALGPTPIIPPIKDHPHSEANSVIGGPVYRGDKLPDLVGAFVYGDYITGTIWAVKPDEDNAYSTTTLVDTDQRITAFTQGSSGELYVLDYDFTGQVYELLPSNVKDTSAEFPRRLSETGLFASLEDLTPAKGVVPYEVQVSRWMDGANAQRWVAIPNDGRIELATSDKAASYPEGIVFVKHLNLPQADGKPIRLETQVLHFEDGTWRPYSYLWDDDGRDARLVDSIGADRALRIPDASAKNGIIERTWHAGAQNECKLCHNAGSNFVLGFEPGQLIRPFNASGTTSQLAALAKQNVVTGLPAKSSDNVLRLVDPHDSTQTIDDRARSYLHANCSMCHHPGGNAIVSFFLRRDLPFDQLRTNKGTGIGTFGMRNAKIIVPGDPYRSVLMYRMAKLGYARMPYIGSQAVDSDGIALIEEWIRSLPNAESENASGPVTENSADAKALALLTANPKSDRDARDAAIRQLIESTEGTLALVGRMHAGSLTSQDFDSAVSIGRQARSSDILGLFETFIPEPERRKRLGPNVAPDTILSLAGDESRGKLIYFSDAARCRACHDLNDANKSLGPTLAEVNKKYERRSEFLQHVLQPSLKVEDKFATYVVLTTDGRIVNGLLIEESDKAVVIKTAERNLVTIARDDIEEMKKSDRSLMPDGILSDLTAQEAADLLTYLRSLTSETTAPK